jgi:hypothetical protein
VVSQFKDLYGVLHLVAKPDRKSPRSRKSVRKLASDWVLGVVDDPYDQLYAMVWAAFFEKE